MKSLPVLLLAGCLFIAAPGVASAASFNDIATGTKTLTGAAKDVHEMNQSDNQQAPKKQQVTKKKEKKAKKSQATTRRAPQQSDRVRGG